MAALSDFGTAGRAGILLIALYDRTALWALPAKNEDCYIAAFRFREFVMESGADDTASCHDSVFHGTCWDFTVCNDESGEHEGDHSGRYENLHPADELCDPACFFFLFFFVIFHINDHNLV